MTGPISQENNRHTMGALQALQRNHVIDSDYLSVLVTLMTQQNRLLALIADKLNDASRQS